MKHRHQDASALVPLKSFRPHVSTERFYWVSGKMRSNPVCRRIVPFRVLGVWLDEEPIDSPL